MDCRNESLFVVRTWVVGKIKRKQITYLLISLFTLLSGVVLTRYYRPYAYRKQLVDFGFADTIGSLVSVLAFCTLVWSLRAYSNRGKNVHILIITFLYAILWEIAGLLDLHGTFDWKDIIAGLLSGGTTYWIKNIVEKVFLNIGVPRR